MSGSAHAAVPGGDYWITAAPGTALRAEAE